MNTAGWLLTENGRQPWIVQGLMLTKDGDLALGQHHRGRDQPRRRSACSTSRWASSDVFLMLRYARRGLELEHADRRRRSRAIRPRRRH